MEPIHFLASLPTKLSSKGLSWEQNGHLEEQYITSQDNFHRRFFKIFYSGETYKITYFKAIKASLRGLLAVC